MKKYNRKNLTSIFASIFIILFFFGCKANVNEPTEPIVSFSLDGTWQSYIFDSTYAFTPTVANLRTNGNEVKGQITSDCYCNASDGNGIS